MSRVLLIFFILKCLSSGCYASSVWKFGQPTATSRTIANLNGTIYSLENRNRLTGNAVIGGVKASGYGRFGQRKDVNTRTSKRESISLPEPCFPNDLPCWNRSLHTFMNKTHQGLPECDITGIDPLFIPRLEYSTDNDNIMFVLRNIYVTGLKDQQLSKFKVDIENKNVLLSTVVDQLVIDADATVEFVKQSTIHTGTFNAVATVAGTARYPYSPRTNEYGEVFIDVGPETIRCESDEDTSTLSEHDITRLLIRDPDIRTVYRNNIVCRIVEAAYTDVIQNLRVAASILPVSAFFKYL